MSQARTSIFCAIAVLSLAHCGVPTPPRCHRVPRESRTPAPTLIASARENWRILSNPALKSRWPAATAAYNEAVAKAFDQLRCGPGTWQTRAASLGTTIAPHDKLLTDPATLDSLVPASSMSIRKVATRHTTPGIGVPIVGWKSTTPLGTKRKKFLLPNGQPYNLTATLDFSTATPTWHFHKRWLINDTSTRHTAHPLAADWTAPNEFFWKMCDVDNLLVQNVILPDRFTDETGLYFVQPYDPEKIPLVLVHGLVSSPDAFKNVINELAPEPWFRERYQIWLYNYPTGNPWLYSAMRFRREMNDAIAFAKTKGPDTHLRRMVIAAHSMGGLITRASLTDPGTVFYDAYFKKPIDRLNVAPENRNIIRDSLLYQPIDPPARVIFMAVPHRGSPMANMFFSNWVSRLIRLPKSLTLDFLDGAIMTAADTARGKDPAMRMPTSITSLSPGSRTIKALNTLPLPDNIIFHSIIGDRGKCNSPDSSDSIVPYWSSHITPVASESIVPCNHSVPDDPAATAELKRIIKLHLRTSPKTRN